MTPREQIKAAMKAVTDAEDAREALCKKLLDEHGDLDRDTKYFAEVFADSTRSANPLPQEVMRIDGKGLLGWLEENRVSLSRAKPGALVKVRPCGDDNPEDKTYLGIFLGELPTGLSFAFNRETGTLLVEPGSGNPAMLVPELGRIVFGCESWWSEVKNADELPQITDEMIENIPYVKALRNAPKL